MDKNNKKDFVETVKSDIEELLELYKVELSNNQTDAFKEDLTVLMIDRLKGSFKNGIRVGRYVKPQPKKD